MQGWIGVDLDGTLATYDHWRGIDHVGKPIKPMCDRVREWISEGKKVRIFTARVYNLEGKALAAVSAPIDMFCRKQFGMTLPITNIKDYGMITLWDDRAVQVIPNTGERVGRSTQEALPPGKDSKHNWVESALGHGETMCSRCCITNREAAVLGVLDSCKAPNG